MFLAVNPSFDLPSFSHISHCDRVDPVFNSVSKSNFLFCTPLRRNYSYRHPSLSANSTRFDSEHDPHPNPKQSSDPKTRYKHDKTKVSRNEDGNSSRVLPTTIPKKPRRGRKSEAAAVEDFVRDSLERTFTSIRQQDSEILKDTGNIMKDKVGDEMDSDGAAGDDDDEKSDTSGKDMVVEEDNPEWPLDAEVGWGIRASEYFEQHPIRNVVGEDGVEIDWEGEVDDSLVKEINCLEWETFAFHPSPLIVLVFERYNRATENWKLLKELEKATKVYWSAKDRLPPRTIKIDINIERDLAYALKIKECPQILFLRGNRIIYREKHIRTADDLVQMIAHFYYKAKKPTCMSGSAFS